MTDSVVDLSVVIPAYNEARRIRDTLNQLQAELARLVPSWEILVVDDGSTDETGDIVAALARESCDVRLIREPHRGKGAAVRVGLTRARGLRRFMCDADLSMPLSELSRFLAAVPTTCDIAIGSREGSGARRIGEPLHRHVIGRLFNMLVRAAGVSRVQDTQCGFKMFTAGAVHAIVPLTTLDGWALDIEILFLAQRRGFRVSALPIEWHYRDQSRVSPLRDGMAMARDVARIRLRALAGRYR